MTRVTKVSHFLLRPLNLSPSKESGSVFL
uniref:Uncharacterized protein n=1 Tax=Anguilla anguilla TaxID=7936 RepID=A0A0E9Q044_ANGAN